MYPSDITQVAYELLNSEVGLVRNLLVLHNTKNLEEEIPYLIFIAHELIHDRNKSDVSIRRIREFFAVKSPSAIETALKVLIARGILKVNGEKQRYGFSTMFYFDFFRSQATDIRLQELSNAMEVPEKVEQCSWEQKVINLLQSEKQISVGKMIDIIDSLQDPRIKEEIVLQMDVSM